MNNDLLGGYFDKPFNYNPKINYSDFLDENKIYKNNIYKNILKESIIEYFHSESNYTSDLDKWFIDIKKKLIMIKNKNPNKSSEMMRDFEKIYFKNNKYVSDNKSIINEIYTKNDTIININLNEDDINIKLTKLKENRKKYLRNDKENIKLLINNYFNNMTFEDLDKTEAKANSGPIKVNIGYIKEYLIILLSKLLLNDLNMDAIIKIYTGKINSVDYMTQRFSFVLNNMIPFSFDISELMKTKNIKNYIVYISLNGYYYEIDKNVENISLIFYYSIDMNYNLKQIYSPPEDKIINMELNFANRIYSPYHYDTFSILLLKPDISVIKNNLYEFYKFLNEDELTIKEETVNYMNPYIDNILNISETDINDIKENYIQKKKDDYIYIKLLLNYLFRDTGELGVNIDLTKNIMDTFIFSGNLNLLFNNSRFETLAGEDTYEQLKTFEHVYINDKRLLNNFNNISEANAEEYIKILGIKEVLDKYKDLTTYIIDSINKKIKSNQTNQLYKYIDELSISNIPNFTEHTNKLTYIICYEILNIIQDIFNNMKNSINYAYSYFYKIILLLDFKFFNGDINVEFKPYFYNIFYNLKEILFNISNSWTVTFDETDPFKQCNEPLKNNGLDIIDTYNIFALKNSLNKITSNSSHIDNNIHETNKLMERSKDKTIYIVLFELYKLYLILNKIDYSFDNLFVTHKNAHFKEFDIVSYILYTYVNIRINIKTGPFINYNINLLFHHKDECMSSIHPVDPDFYIMKDFINNMYLGYTRMEHGENRYYANCGETMILNLINNMIYNKEKKILDVDYLPDNTIDELKEFYKKYNTVAKIDNNIARVQFDNIISKQEFIFQKLDNYNDHFIYTVFRNPERLDKLSFNFTTNFKEAFDKTDKTIHYNGYEFRPSYLNTIRLLDKLFGYYKVDPKYNETNIMETIINGIHSKIDNTQPIKDILSTIKNPSKKEYISQINLVYLAENYTSSSDEIQLLKEININEENDHYYNILYLQNKLVFNDISIVYKPRHSFIEDNISTTSTDRIDANLYRYNYKNLPMNNPSSLITMLLINRPYIDHIKEFIEELITLGIETEDFSNTLFNARIYNVYNSIINFPKENNINFPEIINEKIFKDNEFKMLFKILKKMYTINNKYINDNNHMKIPYTLNLLKKIDDQYLIYYNFRYEPFIHNLINISTDMKILLYYFSNDDIIKSFNMKTGNNILHIIVNIYDEAYTIPTIESIKNFNTVEFYKLLKVKNKKKRTPYAEYNTLDIRHSDFILNNLIPQTDEELFILDNLGVILYDLFDNSYIWFPEIYKKLLYFNIPLHRIILEILKHIYSFSIFKQNELINKSYNIVINFSFTNEKSYLLLDTQYTDLAEINKLKIIDEKIISDFDLNFTGVSLSSDEKLRYNEIIEYYNWISPSNFHKNIFNHINFNEYFSCSEKIKQQLGKIPTKDIDGNNILHYYAINLINILSNSNREKIYHTKYNYTITIPIIDKMIEDFKFYSQFKDLYEDKNNDGWTFIELLFLIPLIINTSNNEFVDQYNQYIYKLIFVFEIINCIQNYYQTKNKDNVDLSKIKYFIFYLEYFTYQIKILDTARLFRTKLKELSLKQIKKIINDINVYNDIHIFKLKNKIINLTRDTLKDPNLTQLLEGKKNQERYDNYFIYLDKNINKDEIKKLDIFKYFVNIKIIKNSDFIKKYKNLKLLLPSDDNRNIMIERYNSVINKFKSPYLTTVTPDVVSTVTPDVVSTVTPVVASDVDNKYMKLYSFIKNKINKYKTKFLLQH